MRTTISGRQLRDDTVDSLNIKDETIATIDIANSAITRSKLYIGNESPANLNECVITKLVAGDNVTISETGADTGTGVVTVNANDVSLWLVDEDGDLHPNTSGTSDTYWEIDVDSDFSPISQI